MESPEELIDKYSEAGVSPTLDELYDRLVKQDIPHEKVILADAYLSEFGQGHYDYMCGKINNIDEVWEMKEWVEKVKTLKPDFDQYFYYMGHVYEMLWHQSSEHDDKITFAKTGIDYFRQQLEYNDQDVMLLIDLAQNLFKYGALTKDYSLQRFNEIKDLFIKSLHLERLEEHQSSFFGFNGSAIHHMITMSYEFLALSFDGNSQWHKKLKTAFESTVEQYVKDDPAIYYHWADTLLRITEWVNYPAIETCRIAPEVVDAIWLGIKKVLNRITDLQSDDEHYLVNLGHLFQRIAEKEVDYHYFMIAYNYYAKALKINNQTWSNPHYASSALRSMALIRLNDGKIEKARSLFNQGLHILEEAQQQLSDFQLSVQHGDFLYDYAKYMENFSNNERLVAAKKIYEESKSLGNGFYTSPYYGLAKVCLRLADKQACLDVLYDCGKQFSNEYHVHDFEEILNDQEFEEVWEAIPGIIADLR